MKADLHIHSTYSDGILSVDELENLAIEKGLDLIAITDHDTVLSYEEIKSKKRKIPIITGVELSTTYNGEIVHILGYFKKNNISNKSIHKYFEKMNKNRKDRLNEIIKKLKKIFDIEITVEEVLKEADGAVGRPHIARVISRKYNMSFNAAFDKFIGDGKPAYVPTDKFNSIQAIDFLHKNNAIVIIPHPILVTHDTLNKIIDYGVDGIEVIHSLHKKKDVKGFKKLAKANNLLMTGGSDFHDYTHKYGFGSYYIEDDEINKFLEKLDIQI